MSRDVQFKQQGEALANGGDVDVDAEHQPETSRKASNAGLNREAVAQRGVKGGGAQLPHLDKIQASFGRHDVSGVQAHTGGEAAEASKEMGAQAYATGGDVAFADQPDLHTAAHEAAHVVQQRGGVQLKGGVGEAGDTHEKQADQVADRVVAGKPAEDLLGAPKANAAPATGGAVQMKDAKDAPKQEPTDADKTKAKQQAEQGTYDALRASMMLTTKRMHNAAAAIRNAMTAPGTDAGDEGRYSAIRMQFDMVQSDAHHINVLISKVGSKTDPMLEQNVHTHGLGKEIKALWGGYKMFADAMSSANNFASARKAALEKNPDWVHQELEVMNTLFGSDYAKSEGSADTTPTTSIVAQDQSEAIHEHLSGALSAAQALHVGTPNGSARLKLHVKEARELIKPLEAQGKEAGKAMAPFKKDIASLVKEVHALEVDKPGMVPIIKDVHPAIEELDKLAK